MLSRRRGAGGHDADARWHACVRVRVSARGLHTLLSSHTSGHCHCHSGLTSPAHAPVESLAHTLATPRRTCNFTLLYMARDMRSPSHVHMRSVMTHVWTHVQTRQIGSGGAEVVTLAEPDSGERRSTGCAASPRATSSSRYQPEDQGLRPRWKVLMASGAPRSGVMSCPFQKGRAAPRAVRACRRCTARAPPRRPRWATSRACRAGAACRLHSLRHGHVPWRC